ncbi:cobalt ECF transporter T component CbiQ [Desulfitobacterium sp. Sab5]|uniref:cobalt ECF transporter T component CbiQ n=1 Tax=Desulfitobacterium nosdiversum TaxID=3375356 RepID=UPI003CE6B192
MISIDQYVYANKLMEVHPIEKFSLTITTMVVCLSSPSIYTPILAMIIMAWLVIVKAGIPAKFFIHLLGIPIVFLLMGELTLVFSISNRIEDFLYYWGSGSYIIGITLLDINNALLLFFKSLGTVSCLYFLALTTPMVEIIAVLRKLKMPKLFIELMSLIYRFIFVLLESAAAIYMAQGSRLGYVTLRSSFRSISHLIYAIFVRSIQRSQMLATALEARCYQGEIRVLEKEFAVSKRSIVFIIMVESVLILSSVILKGGNFFG